jgi:hypothetical protein
MNPKEIVSEVVAWIYLVSDSYDWWADVNTVMNLRVAWKTGSF